MKKNLLLFMTALYCLACQNSNIKSDAWENFLKCTEQNCLKETIAVKDAFLKNPKDVLTQFQATADSGDDRVLGWLFTFRDSVLLNPKMGTIDERIKMQESLINASKPFEKDQKLKEISKNVIDYLSAADVKAGKIKENTYCYQFNNQGEHAYCQLIVTENGDYHGYFNYFIEGKDGKSGVLASGNSFFNDTLSMDFHNMQEGIVTTEKLVFLKKGDDLVALEMDYDTKKRVLGNTLKPADCSKLETYLAPIVKMEAAGDFKYPEPNLSENDYKKVDKMQGVWQSKDDPKSSIEINNGYFSYVYLGQKKEDFRYIYYPVCPNDCNPVAKTPCLRVIEKETTTCFNIVKADGKVLELSQIGGTGNTNRYIKKK